MKKLFLNIVLLLCVKVLFAQQLPHYTQYVLNNYILNPAVSGIENYIDVKLSARDQWVGLKGAPKTMYLSVHGPIGKKDFKTTATSFNMDGENPRGKAYWETYTASQPHHGVGLVMMNDKTGNFNRVSVSASYAYHLGLTPRTNLSAGFSAGFYNISRAHDKSYYDDGINSDPAEANPDLLGIKPDMTAGVWLYSADYFAGVSIQQVIPNKNSLQENSSPGAKLLPHFFFTAGYRVYINEDLNAVPSLMVKYVNSSSQVEGNFKMQYRDVFWLGASYRHQDGFAAMTGVNISNTFNIGYAYDFTTSALKTASRGTHEIMLGFLVGNKYGDWCPRKLW